MLLEVPCLPGQPGAVRREHLEDAVGHDAVTHVVGVAAIAVHQPVGVVVGVQHVGEEAAVRLGHLPGRVVVVVKQLEAAVTEAADSAQGEVVHVVGAEQHDERRGVEPFPHAPQQVDHLVTEKIDGCAAPRVVQPVGDDQQIGLVGQDVLVETLARRGLAAVVVVGASGADEVGPDADVHQVQWRALELVDQAGELARPAAFPGARPAPGRCALAEGDEGAELLLVPVLLHGGENSRFQIINKLTFPI